MCLFYNRRLFVIQLIEILLLLLTDHNGRLTLTKESTTGECGYLCHISNSKFAVVMPTRQLFRPNLSVFSRFIII